MGSRHQVAITQFSILASLDNNTSANIEVIASNKGNMSKVLTRSKEFAKYLNLTETSSQRARRKNVFVVCFSMLYNIREHGLSKQQSVKIKNFPRTSTERINKEFDDILLTIPDLLIIHASHAETNDFSVKINQLNNLR